MTPRQIQFWGYLLSAGFVGLAVWAFIDARYLSGAFYFVFGVVWLLKTIFRDRLEAARGIQRSRIPR